MITRERDQETTLTQSITPFATHATTRAGIAGDVIAYVIEHGHAWTIPVDALHMANKLAVQVIAEPPIPRPTDDNPNPEKQTIHPIMLREVNAVIDIVQDTIRIVEKNARESAQDGAQAQPAGQDSPSDGWEEFARLQPAGPTIPPSDGNAIAIDWRKEIAAEKQNRRLEAVDIPF